jgi:threonine/homoserine/homoserine lactone efflux protein
MGSLQPGPLNMSVVQLSLHDNPKGALKMNVGGCIPEFVYSLLAAEGLVIFQYYPWLLTYLAMGSSAITVDIGVFYMDQQTASTY